jgi:hypothetical protein
MISTTVVMMLRVYAMWHRSRRVIYLLVFMLILQGITLSVTLGINSPSFTGMYLLALFRFDTITLISCLVSVARVLDIPFCTFSDNISPILNLYLSIPRFSLSFTLLVLSVISTLKESIQMYRETRQWKPNRYLQMIVKDGTIYFLGYVRL